MRRKKRDNSARLKFGQNFMAVSRNNQSGREFSLETGVTEFFLNQSKQASKLKRSIGSASVATLCPQESARQKEASGGCEKDMFGAPCARKSFFNIRSAINLASSREARAFRAVYAAPKEGSAERTASKRGAENIFSARFIKAGSASGSGGFAPARTGATTDLVNRVYQPRKSRSLVTQTGSYTRRQ